jgi:hypothetical protein
LIARPAAAETVALVVASPESDEAARYLSTLLDLPVVRRTSRNARHLDALVVEARANFRDDLVVVVDTAHAVVSVVRPWDGTVGSRALAPSAASAPYAVALAAVELIEIVRNAPPARSAALPEPRPRSRLVALAFDLGLVQSLSTNGYLGLLQPTIGVDMELSRERHPVWLAAGLHATGLASGRRNQTFVLPAGSDGQGSLEYSRSELSLRLGAGHRQGQSAAVGWCDLGLASIQVTARDAYQNAVGADQRVAFWLGVGGELRYTLGEGFALGIGAGAAWFPVTSRFYASPPGATTPLLALDEGTAEFRGRAALVWEAFP